MAKSKSKFSENMIRFQCTICKQYNHFSRKNKKLVERKLEYSKYCRHCRKHTKHKEAKKK